VEPLGIKVEAPSRAENNVHSSLRLRPRDFCEGLKDIFGQKTILKKTTSLILKISITLALLIFLFRKTDFATLSEVVKGADTLKMCVALFLFFFLNLLILLRWHLLLKGLAINVKMGRLFLSYFSALFFNLVLPSTIGGDAVRTLDIAHHAKVHSSWILATVVLDRVAGFIGLISVLIVALIFGYGVLNDVSILYVALILFLAVIFLTGVMFSENFFHSVFSFLPFKKLKDYLYKIHEATSSYKQKKEILLWAWFLSVLAHVGLSFVYYITALALGIHLKLVYFIIFVPVITAFSALPLSVGGLGLRDSASIFVFAKVGLMAEKAFALSLLNFGFMLVIGLLGGIGYVFSLHHRRV
jgi:uncharacterized protein (TIRG00374 family)